MPASCCATAPASFLALPTGKRCTKVVVVLMGRMAMAPAALALALGSLAPGGLGVAVPGRQPPRPGAPRVQVYVTPAPAPAAAEIPVPPPAGATPSQTEITPFTRSASPALRTKVLYYAVDLTPQQVYDYYLPRLTALGYSAQITGESCGPGHPCASDWGFTKGSWFSEHFAELDLTVQPTTAGASVYSVQEQVLSMPPATVPARYANAKPDTLRTNGRSVAKRGLVREIYRALLGLREVPPGAYSCPQMGIGDSVVLRFLQHGRTVLTATVPESGCRFITIRGIRGARAPDATFMHLLRAIDLIGV